MFTIKHIDSQGSETAIECQTYDISQDQRFGLGGVMVCAYDTPFRTSENIGCWLGMRQWQRRPGDHEIHIMNSRGATVSSVYFSDHAMPEGAAQQADPEKLAA